MDYVKNYLEKNKIPVTRENYVGLNWMGELPVDKPLPAELEAALPKEIQLNQEENDNANKE